MGVANDKENVVDKGLCNHSKLSTAVFEYNTFPVMQNTSIHNMTKPYLPQVQNQFINFTFDIWVCVVVMHILYVYHYTYHVCTSLTKQAIVELHCLSLLRCIHSEVILVKKKMYIQCNTGGQ